MPWSPSFGDDSIFTKKSFFFSLSAWWDAGKACLRRKIRAFCRKKTSVFRKRVLSLEHTLFFLCCHAVFIADTQGVLQAVGNSVCFWPSVLCGVIVSSLVDISHTLVFSYGLSFTTQPLDQISKRLTDAQHKLCKGKLTLVECKAALDGMATGKSRGLDGFPAKFYLF